MKLSQGEEAHSQRPVSGLARPLISGPGSRVSESEDLGGLNPESQAPVTVSPHPAATGPSHTINKTFSDVSGADTFCFETVFVPAAQAALA